MSYRVAETHLPFYHRYYIEIFDGIGWVQPACLEGNGLYIENKFKSLAELKTAVRMLTENKK